MARSLGFPSFDDFLAQGWWAPQNVELEGDLLHFTGSPRTAAPPDENTFARYLELAGSDQVLAFAKRFGPLFMEERTAVASGGFVFPHPATEYLEDGAEVIRERVADWCFRAASDRRLIETAKLLRGGQSVPEENWLA